MENNQEEKTVRTGDLAPWVACLQCQIQEAAITGGMQKVSHILNVQQRCSIGSIVLHSC